MNYPVLPVNIDSIKFEPHAVAVNTPTRVEQQPLAMGETPSAQESLGPTPEGIRFPYSMAQNHPLGLVNNRHPLGGYRPFSSPLQFSQSSGTPGIVMTVRLTPIMGILAFKSTLTPWGGSIQNVASAGKPLASLTTTVYIPSGISSIL